MRSAVEDGLEQPRRERLGLVEDDDAAREAVELAAGAGRLAKRLSKSWTVVVTTTEASQFSVATRFCRPSSAGVSRAGSKALWCSSTASAPSARAVGLGALLDDGGERDRHHRRARARGLARARGAKASDASVLPPPVGTVRLKTPGGSAATATQARRTSARTRLTSVSGARPWRASSWPDRRCSSVAIDGAPPRVAARPCVVERLGVEEVGVAERGEEHPRPHLPEAPVLRRCGRRGGPAAASGAAARRRGAARRLVWRDRAGLL